MKKYILLLLCLIALSGCGAGGGSAPPGSTITIATPDTVTNTNPTIEQGNQSLQIIVKDSNGNGVKNAKISIKFVYTTTPDQNIISDLSSIVTLCDGTYIVNTVVDRETDDWGGYNLCISYQNGGGLSYSGTINVYSGDQVATATFIVST